MQNAAENMKTWLEIDQKALLSNVTTVRRFCGDDIALMAVVKANAYGHGLREVAQILSGQATKRLVMPATTFWYGVDSLDEALVIQQYNARQPIMILGYIPKSRIPEALKGNFHISLYSKESLYTIYDELKKITNKKGATKITPHFHCKIETGTNRLGLSLDDLKKFPLRFPVDGIYTHFAETENPQSRFYQKQLAVLQQARALLATKNIFPRFIHSASTAALLQYPETHGNLVRLGIGLYGLWPSEEVKDYLAPANKLLSPQSQWGTDTSSNTPKFCPALTWKTRIAQVKKIKKGETVGYDRTWRARRSSTTAILPVGYYDGYDRRLSGCGEVLIRGKRAPVVGRVCMNMILVDVTGIPAHPDDETVLIGAQGREEITADEIAKKIGTINYEVVSRINPLLHRIIV